jgi:endo-1,4-beta-mannosidase
MTQLLQIAAGYDMKVIFTLFEWHNEYPRPGERDYTRQLAYMRGLVAPFANDDRVLAWDLHNEPEHYPTWISGRKDVVIAWAANIAVALRQIDRNHMLTIGVANYETLFAQASDGRKLIDIVDLVSFHCYDAGALRTQINALEKLTSKPLLLEEMGWPTGPAELSTGAARYDEATQLFLYRSMLGDAKASSLVGVVQWMLWDYLPGYDRSKGDTLSYEPYFGLVRLDGSLKPAAAEFREAYRVSPLPSRTKTDFPLTKQDGD